MRGTIRKTIFKIVGPVQVFLTVAAGSISATLKANPADVAKHLGKFASDVLQLLQDSAWIGVPILLVAAATCGVIKKRLGDPSMWQFVQELLDDFRDRIFSDSGSDYQHHHRVTLFKHVSCTFAMRSWPCSGWLKPVKRSGHTSQVSKARFRAPDESDNCEGVVGLAWCAQGALKIQQLPDVRASSQPEVIAEYAAKTNVTDEFVRTHLPKTRSFYAVRVEVKGEQWGVIVVDSRKEKLNFRRITNEYEVIGRYLGLVLQRL